MVGVSSSYEMAGIALEIFETRPLVSMLDVACKTLLIAVREAALRVIENDADAVGPDGVKDFPAARFLPNDALLHYCVLKDTCLDAEYVLDTVHGNLVRTPQWKGAADVLIDYAGKLASFATIPDALRNRQKRTYQHTRNELLTGCLFSLTPLFGDLGSGLKATESRSSADNAAEFAFLERPIEEDGTASTRLLLQADSCRRMAEVKTGYKCCALHETRSQSSQDRLMKTLNLADVS